MFHSRRSAQWLDGRTVQLTLSNTRHQVCTKQGHTLWPEHPLWPGPGAVRRAEELSEYSMTLAECNWRWVRGVESFERFRDDVIARCTIHGTRGYALTPVVLRIPEGGSAAGRANL